MKFSVVLSAYNVENYIEKTLQCLLQQTYHDFEVILVDDCATDTTGQIADHYQMNFKQLGVPYTVIHKPENEGLSMARNTGMDHAKGEYVFFFDTDDLLETTMFETIEKALGTNRPDVFIFGFFEDYYKQESLTYRVEKMPESHFFSNQERKERFYAAFPYITKLEQQTIFGYAWNKAYRLEFLKEKNLRFDTVTHIEDVLFNIGVAKNMQSMQTVPYMLYHYCNRGQVRLTGKYLPQYFELQKRRFEEFLSMQQEKISVCRRRPGEMDETGIQTWEQDLMGAMAGAYFRAFQSFMVREIAHGTPKRQIMQKANAETEGILYQQLCKSLSQEGKVAKILYRPLADGRINVAYTRAKFICFVQRHFPGLFAKLKQNR